MSKTLSYLKPSRSGDPEEKGEEQEEEKQKQEEREKEEEEKKSHQQSTDTNMSPIWIWLNILLDLKNCKGGKKETNELMYISWYPEMSISLLIVRGLEV